MLRVARRPKALAVVEHRPVGIAPADERAVKARPPDPGVETSTRLPALRELQVLARDREADHAVFLEEERHAELERGQRAGPLRQRRRHGQKEAVAVERARRLRARCAAVSGPHPSPAAIWNVANRA
jgi:hypothetical protein